MPATANIGKAVVASALREAKELVEELEMFDESSSSYFPLQQRARNIHFMLEDPYQMLTRWIEDLSVMTALYALTRIKGFEKLPSEGTVAAANLATKCGVDASIITRNMRVLVKNGIGEEPEADEYKHNDLSRRFLPSDLGGFVCVMYDTLRAVAAIPDYMKNHKPEEVHDIHKCVYAFAMGHQGKTYYEAVEMDPQQRMLLDIGTRASDRNFPIVGLFPFEDMEQSVKDEPERPFVVDIAGNRGHQLRAIQQYCGGSFGGRLILQDLPVVIEAIKPEDIPGIEAMAYDALMPQPVKNAHVYFMRRFLHDYPDPLVIIMLKNTASAMGPTSRLVIGDMILPERVTRGGQQTAYWVDLALLSLGGRVRMLREWTSLLDEAGLEISKVHESADGQTMMMETRLKA